MSFMLFVTGYMEELNSFHIDWYRTLIFSVSDIIDQYGILFDF